MTPDPRAATRTAICVVMLALLTTIADILFPDSTIDGSVVPADMVSRHIDRSIDESTLRPSARLAAGVHPAADPTFGSLWAVSQQLIIPVAGKDPSELTDSFRDERGGNRLHDGIDIPAPRGTPVLAATDGVITRLTVHDSGGISLFQVAPDRQTTLYYAHLSRYASGVREGKAVRRGDVIGYVGDTGNAGKGNYHLHFEVMSLRGNRDPKVRNPYPLLVREPRRARDRGRG